MDTRTRLLAAQVVLDILGERRDTTGEFRMHGVAPGYNLPPDRRARADRFRHMVPATATAADVGILADRIAPHLIVRT